MERVKKMREEMSSKMDEMKVRKWFRLTTVEQVFVPTTYLKIVPCPPKKII